MNKFKWVNWYSNFIPLLPTTCTVLVTNSKLTPTHRAILLHILHLRTCHFYLRTPQNRDHYRSQLQSAQFHCAQFGLDLRIAFYWSVFIYCFANGHMSLSSPWIKKPLAHMALNCVVYIRSIDATHEILTCFICFLTRALFSRFHLSLLNRLLQFLSTNHLLLRVLCRLRDLGWTLLAILSNCIYLIFVFT